MANGATAASQKAQINGVPAADCVQEFCDFVSHYHNSRGFHDLKVLFQENEELRKKLSESEATHQGNILTLARQIDDSKSKSEQLETLNKRVNESDAATQSLKQDFEKQTDEHNASFAKLQKQRDNDGKELTRLYLEVKKLEIKEGELSKLMGENEKLHASLKEKDKANSELALDKQNIHSKLVFLEKRSFPLVPFSDKQCNLSKEALRKIASASRNLARQFFFQDIEADSFASQAWALIKMHKHPAVVNSSIRLPASNTLVAKQMRFIVALKFIGRTLADRIFQPVYLDENANEVCELIQKLSTEDTGHGNYVRSVLLNVLPEEQIKFGEVQAENAVSEIREALNDFIIQDKRGAFENAVYQLCANALQAWRPLQELDDEVEVDFVFDQNEPDEWRFLEMPEPQPSTSGSKTGPKPDKSKQNKEDASNLCQAQRSVIWPTITFDDVVLHPGWVIPEKQIKVAKDEFLAAIMKDEETQRDSRKRERRSSIAPGNNESHIRGISSFLPKRLGSGAGKR